MACLEMYNSEHKGHHHNQYHNHSLSVSPRISFSNDFVDTQQVSNQEKTTTKSDGPVSTDFEFSVSNYSMMSADELFFKGRLLPFKDSSKKITTLREELLVDDDEVCERQGFSLRPPKGSSSSTTRWKGFLGLRKSHIGSKKVEKSENVESRRSGLVNESARLNIATPQEILIEGGSNCSDFEFGI
ncbi:unnamed protein product [Lathyrus sativus]|nr:unnamed protein product [Lathyrus sativus]